VDVFYVDQNFFNPAVKPLGIYLRVDQAGQVKLLVFNIAGEEVAALLNQSEAAGQYNLSWDGHNKSGAVVGNGVYFIVLQQPSGKTVRKVIVLK
jgi:flagellar hook assembly protein FlgD